MAFAFCDRHIDEYRTQGYDAGDFCLYRNTLWHIGNYVPYAKRATLHDAVDTDEFAAWRDETMGIVQERRAAGHGMENPNYG